MSESADRLVRMANDIAKNLAVMGGGDAAKATAEHIDLFWAPSMQAKAIELMRSGNAGFNDTARAALELLAERTGHPAG